MNQISNNNYLLDSSEEILKYLTHEIIRKCSQNGIRLSSNFVSLTIELFSLHPVDGISLNTKINKIYLEKFIEKCILEFSSKYNFIYKIKLNHIKNNYIFIQT